MCGRPDRRTIKRRSTLGGDMGSAQRQGALWGAAAEEWAELQEPSGTPLFDASFDAIGVTNGTRLLDVGCGAGVALQLAHKRGARVAGLDAAEPQLAVARSMLPEADLRHGDIEELPFPDDCFDAVTAFNSVQYATEPVRALAEIRRVAVPGAPVAVATWGNPERCDARHLIGALGSVLPPPPAGASGPFALAVPGALEALVETARLTAEHAFDVDVPFAYPDLGTSVRAALSSGPARAAIDHAGRDGVVEAITPVLDRFAGPDGSVRLENVFRVVIARA
jgi:SAM-dependent methyltransferase